MRSRYGCVEQQGNGRDVERVCDGLRVIAASPGHLRGQRRLGDGRRHRHERRHSGTPGTQQGAGSPPTTISMMASLARPASCLPGRVAYAIARGAEQGRDDGRDDARHGTTSEGNAGHSSGDRAGPAGDPRDGARRASESDRPRLAELHGCRRRARPRRRRPDEAPPGRLARALVAGREQAGARAGDRGAADRRVARGGARPRADDHRWSLRRALRALGLAAHPAWRRAGGGPAELPERAARDHRLVPAAPAHAAPRDP